VSEGVKLGASAPGLTPGSPTAQTPRWSVAGRSARIGDMMPGALGGEGMSLKKKLRVGLLFGGRSVEHAVSIVSATSILEALDRKRYDVQLVAIDLAGEWHLASADALPAESIHAPGVFLPGVPGDPTLIPVASSSADAADLDVIFPIVHGRSGEDGCLQGLLEMAEVAYVGSGVASSAIQMDKDLSKRLLAAEDLPVVPWMTLRADALADEQIPETADAVMRELGERLFVKPANSGSSLGIHLCESVEELIAGIRDAARYDTKLIVERAVDGREVEVAVIGNDEPQASLPGEIRAHARFYDYEAKYQDDATELIIPAELDDAQTEAIRRLAVQAYLALEASGLARVDFLIDNADGAPYINELNSLPGFTSGSMFPRLWEATGLSYSALLDRLIELALERHEKNAKLETQPPS
jgi:D-alanine-D-alanine ligase